MAVIIAHATPEVPNAPCLHPGTWTYPQEIERAHRGIPYLKTHAFDGWHLSLTGRYKNFTMSRGIASFKVTGTDFPLNCS